MKILEETAEIPEAEEIRKATEIRKEAARKINSVEENKEISKQGVGIPQRNPDSARVDSAGGVNAATDSVLSGAGERIIRQKARYRRQSGICGWIPDGKSRKPAAQRLLRGWKAVTCTAVTRAEGKRGNTGSGDSSGTGA